MDQPKAPRRHRGAQPGNNNALKHGFYARRFRDLEDIDLDVLAATLESEIMGLRVVNRRILELSDDFPENPWFAVQTLSLFGNKCVQIATLARTNLMLTGGKSDATATISLALEAAIKELKIC